MTMNENIADYVLNNDPHIATLLTDTYDEYDDTADIMPCDVKDMVYNLIYDGVADYAINNNEDDDFVDKYFNDVYDYILNLY